jgi:hypothetical protein
LQHAFEDFLSRLKRVSADKPDDNTGEICRLGFYKAAAKLVAVGLPPCRAAEARKIRANHLY